MVLKGSFLFSVVSVNSSLNLSVCSSLLFHQQEASGHSLSNCWKMLGVVLMFAIHMKEILDHGLFDFSWLFFFPLAF